MPDGANPAPGYTRNPDHTVRFEKSDKRIVVKFADEVIADTQQALICKESGYQDAFYIPMTDTNLGVFRPTDHSSFCPYKGEASYWTIEIGGARSVNAAWSYDLPFDEAAEVIQHFAFYPDRVESIEVL